MRVFVLTLCWMMLLALAAPAMAQTAGSARGEAFGAEIRGAVEFGPEPGPVTAEVPPGEEDSDNVVEVPAEPLVFSATIAAAADAASDATVPATLQDVIDGASDAELPEAWNARGHAITEDLQALFAEEEEPQLTADVVESEALAYCDDTAGAVFATGSRVQNLTLAGEQLDVLDPVVELVVQGEPNEDVLANLPGVGEALAELGLSVTAWETNWDGSDGTTDGSDTVWVNALRVQVAEDSELGGIVGAQDITVSHSEAEVDCDADVDPAENPLGEVSKDASADTVLPGDTFTYEITVPNSDTECTLENVQVIDQISGPAGSEIVGTNPEADDVTDLTVTWDDVGPIAPGDSVTLTVDVRVPDSATDGDRYHEDVTVTGECDDQPVEGSVDFDGPQVGAVTKPAGGGGGGGDELPRTGGVLTGLGGLLVAGGAVAAALRRWLR